MPLDPAAQAIPVAVEAIAQTAEFPRAVFA